MMFPYEDFHDYQLAAKETAIYPDDYAITYPVLGLAGEAGEIANKWKKVIRDDNIDAWSHDDMVKELGDVLWYIAAICNDANLDLSEVARKNIEKLRSRQERGVLGGSGDNR